MVLVICKNPASKSVVSLLFSIFAGYGTTVPLSDEGRVFCIVYCLVGIPLTLLLLSSLTHALLPWVTHTPIHNLQVFWGLSRNHAALLHCSVLAFCTATLFFLLPAGALCLLENDWSYLESLYFCFVSLSTTGLIDYLPGRTQSRVARQLLEFATSCKLCMYYCLEVDIYPSLIKLLVNWLVKLIEKSDGDS